MADLLFLLHGENDLVNETPMLQIAKLAVELELAERLIDGGVNDMVSETAILWRTIN